MSRDRPSGLVDREAASELRFHSAGVAARPTSRLQHRSLLAVLTAIMLALLVPADADAARTGHAP